MLRAVRLAAKLEFSIDAASAEPIARLAPLLAEASNARLFDESLKLFLAGHSARVFDLLERHGLLPHLLPDTATALALDTSGLCRDMLMTALRNCDARVAEDKSVAPAFLFAALLWPAYAQDLQVLLAQGCDMAVAEQRAADRVTLRQAGRIAIPRRFSTPMHEIWWLQSRFSQRQRKRVFRLLAHPRFRAAFDFLELRASVVPELREEAQWWAKAQGMPSDALAAQLPGKIAGAPRPRAAADAEPPPAEGEARPRSARRRRRPRKTAE
jgi:poly(A) polymerase